MGVDLTLLVTHGDRETNAACPFAHTVIGVGLDYDLWGRIEKLPLEPVPPGFTSYVSREGDPDLDSHYGVVTEDCYGKPLKWVEAGALASVNVGKNPVVRTRAAWAFLKALPPTWMVALYWH